MNHYEQLIYLLGYIKASIEWICTLAFEAKFDYLFNVLTDFEQYVNQEMKKIFS